MFSLLFNIITLFSLKPQHSVSGNNFNGGFGTSNTGSNNGAVAFSVTRANLFSLSAPVFIKFEETLTNVGYGWNGQSSTFQVSAYLNLDNYFNKQVWLSVLS